MTMLNRSAQALLLAAALAAAGCDSVEERVEKHHARGVELLAAGDPVKAGLEFRNALKLNENHAPSRYQIALAYEREGEIAAALGNFRLAAELDKANAGARIKLAQIMLLGGDMDEARRNAAEALALTPEDPDALAAQAAVLYRSGETAEAVALAEKALAAAPTHVAALMVLASERYAAGDPTGALNRLDAALEVAPRETMLNMLKLRILEAEKQTDALESHLTRMIDIFPEEKRYRQAVVSLRLQRDDLAGAESGLRDIAAAFPADAEAALDVVRFILQRDGADAARAEIARRLEAGPDPAVDFDLRLAATDVERAAGAVDAARAGLEALLGDAQTVAQRGRIRRQLARYAVGAGDRAAARALLDAVLAEDKADAEALAMRATMLIEDDDPSAALVDLRTAADADPQNTEVMLLTARAYERNGSFDLAGERLAAATRASGHTPEIAVAYARFLLGRNRGEAAEEVLREAARRNPDSVATWAALTEQRMRLSDFEGAAEAAKELSRLRGDDKATRQVAALTLGAEGKLDESIGMLQELAEDPSTGSGTMVALVGAYLRNGEIERAESFIDGRIADAPDDVPARLLRAELHLARNDRPAAEAALRDIMERFPASPLGFVAMGRLLQMDGRTDDALATLRQGVATATPPNAVRLQLAGLLEQRRDFDGAIAEYEALYESQPDSIVVANNLASLLAEHRADDPASVERAARVAQRLRGSEVPELQDTYGWTLFLRGDYADALRSLAPAAESRPDNPLIRFHAGMAFLRQGLHKEARTHLQAALDLDADFPKAAEARAALAEIPAGG